MNELDQKIEQILKDLYQIDSSFGQYESRIKTIIKEVLLAKPDTKFDEQFALSLRHKLLAQVDLQKEKQNLSLLSSLKFLKKLNFALSALAVIAIVAGVGVYHRQNRITSPASNNLTPLLSSGVKITPVEKEAFGKLAISSDNGAPLGMGGAGAASQSEKSSAPAVPRSMGMGGGAGTSLPLINYQYVYKGDKITVDKNQMEVYRRAKVSATVADVSSLLKQMNFGLLNIDTFSNMTIQMMNLVEDKEYGYNFYINLQEGTIDASENWLRWPNPEMQCKDPQCFDALRLKISDIPDDQTLISITDQFLKDHGMPAENYNAPFVQDSWRDGYNNASDKANSYIPTILTVIYPQKLNDNEIYDEGGNKTGPTVSVDVRAKKVSGFSELYALNYDSSLYNVETDVDKLLSFAEKGGYHGSYLSGSPARTVQIELGTPHIAYMKTFLFQREQGQPSEILVPSLVFPITKVPQGQPFYRKNVIVPLAKDLLPEDNGPIQIMPVQ